MQKLLFHPLTALFLTLLTIIFLISLYHNILDIRKSTETITVLDQENQKLASEISNLEKKLVDTRSDFVQEKITRDELLMQKPGEFIVQLPPLPSPNPQPQLNQQSTTPWQEWRQILFN